MNIPLISKIKSLPILCAFVIVGSWQFTQAAERGDNKELLEAGSSATTKTINIHPHRGSGTAASANSTNPRAGAIPRSPRVNAAKDEEITALKERLARQESALTAQQERLAKLEAAFEELKTTSGRFLVPLPERPEAPKAVEIASTQGHLPPVAAKGGAARSPLAPLSVDTMLRKPNDLAGLALSNLAPAGSSSSGPAQAGQEETPTYITRLDRLDKEIEGISRSIAGFRFSGSLRLRSDNIFRSSNAVSGPLQRSRGQYRARLNLDKGISSQLDVHFQLGSGRFDNPLTDDTDFAGGAVRGPIFLSEAWADYHPNSTLSFRGGKMPEVFQDYVRFMWDEDMRFNGFQESVGMSPGGNPLGITRIDFRAAQYPLTDPNIQVLPSAAQCASPTAAPAACAYLKAGYKPGEKVRAADLFDQGIFVKGQVKPGWSHYFFSNFMLFRNPSQIALASTSSGFPLLVNPAQGVSLAGPLPGTGTATTLPGGGIFTASHFQIGRVAYRITKEGWKFRDEQFPVFLDVQASRNFGTSFLRNAWMATLNAGEIKKAGDVRFLYFFASKEGNSMISQFTDDHVGTLSGVNIRTHAIRFDLGLAKYLQLQNIFYIQNEISPNDPARHFFVVLPRGTATTYRMESSIFVNF